MLVLHGGSTAVTDHRLMNALRHIRPQKVTIRSASELIKDKKASILDNIDASIAALPDHQFDVIWSNLHLFEIGALFEWARQERGARTILDYDDLLTEAPPWHPSATAFVAKFAERLRVSHDAADKTVASTPFIRDHFKCNVLAPNFADPENWVAPPMRKEGLRIVFPISSSRMVEWDELMSGPVRYILDHYDHVQAVFVGGWPAWTDDYPVGQVVKIQWMPVWVYKRMMGALQPDVICSALMDHDFNRSRSNLKWLEAGTLKAAFLGSDIGELSRTVTDKEDGILVQDSDWLSAMEEIVVNHSLRQSLALGAHTSVMERWTWPAVADSWLEVFS